MTADTINPYAEVKVNYEGSNHSLTWITTYGVEQPSQTLASGTTTLRTGLNADVRSNFADQVDGWTVIIITSENQAAQSVNRLRQARRMPCNFTLSLRYTINKHFAVHVDYDVHTLRTRQEGQAGYSRNHYFAGLTYHY